MRLIRTLSMLIAALSLGACHYIDDTRIPPVAVYVPFITQGQWDIYGVHAAGSWKRFIKSQRIPADYPYSSLCETGFGGVLLTCDYLGNPIAYDLACPVECRSDVRVVVDPENLVARCPVCHSEYEVFSLNYGYPVAGPAATDGYGLQVYHVVPGSNAEYRVITR